MFCTSSNTAITFKLFQVLKLLLGINGVRDEPSLRDSLSFYSLQMTAISWGVTANPTNHTKYMIHGDYPANSKAISCGECHNQSGISECHIRSWHGGIVYITPQNKSLRHHANASHHQCAEGRITQPAGYRTPLGYDLVWLTHNRTLCTSIL